MANEALYIAVSQLGTIDVTPKPLLIVPVCNHTYGAFAQHLTTIIDCIESSNPQATILNIATDGDHFRRKLLNELRRPSSIALNVLPYFSTQLVLGKFTLNFDVKHLVKRLRGILISNNRSITLIKRPINRGLLLLMEPNLAKYMDPHDYQNVPYAVDLLQSIVRLARIEKNNVLEIDVLYEIKCLAEISSALLSIFVDPKINLLDQLVKLAYCSHLLLFIYRRWRGSFITSQLYSDIQATIQDAFVVAETFSRLCPYIKLMLHHLGTLGYQKIHK